MKHQIVNCKLLKVLGYKYKNVYFEYMAKLISIIFHDFNVLIDQKCFVSFVEKRNFECKENEVICDDEPTIFIKLCLIFEHVVNYLRNMEDFETFTIIIKDVKVTIYMLI